MSRFDEIRAININDKNFNRSHNGLIFQTKDFECEGFLYCIFNGELYQESGEENEDYTFAQKLDYSGEINIYTSYDSFTDNNMELWAEYDLTFSCGRLTGITPHEVIILKDNRDFSDRRPHKPDNRVEVSISVRNCDSDKQNAVISSITDEKLAAIREILADPTATIFYPAKVSGNYPHLSVPRLWTVASVVQKKEDFEQTGKITAPNGDRIILKDKFF